MNQLLRKALTLRSPEGMVLACAEIIKEYPNTIISEDTDPESITISLNFNGKKYSAKGTDYLGYDALARLQASLPCSVKICCCMTCCHGVMDPFGNEPGILFCAKELSKKDKNSLIPHFSGTGKPLTPVSLESICPSFVLQEADSDVYNDYYLCLQECSTK